MSTRFDPFGLRRALPDRLLPLVVGAMAFLGALALTGLVAADSLARHWQGDAASLLTVQVPHPADAAAGRDGGNQTGRRLDAVLAALRASAGVSDLHVMTTAELATLLHPWLGNVPPDALPLPAVIEARLADPPPDLTLLGKTMDTLAPGTLTESGQAWSQRLAVLARSLQACAAMVLVIVISVAILVVTVAVRSGLSRRRDAIEIVHGLGATDGAIASRFAARAFTLTLCGAAIGTAAALPVLLGLVILTAPFAGAASPEAGALSTLGHGLDTLPRSIWLSLPLLPFLAALLGWSTAQHTVRRWLQRLA